MKLRAVGPATVALALALLVSGCAGTPELESEATPSVKPSDAPEASPEAEVSGPEPLSCDTLVTEATIEDFEANGFVSMPDYESDLRSDDSVEAKFFDFGGIACLWVLPNSDGWAAFGYSEITDADATTVQAELETSGYVRTVEGSDVVYAINPANNSLGHNDTFLFEPGAWYHSVERRGIDEVRAQIAERDAE